MKRFATTNIFIIVLAILAVILGYNYVRRPFLAQTKNEPLPESASPSAQVTDSATERIQKLSIKDKLSQLLVVQLSVEKASTSTQSAQKTGLTYSPTIAQELRQMNPGMIVLVGAHTASESATTIIDSLNQTKQGAWPVLLAINQANSRSLSRSESFGIPQNLAKACQTDVQKAGEEWRTVAQKWQQLGVAVVLGPVIDIPKPDSLYSSLGCQPMDQSLKLAQEYVVSFGQYGIMSVVAHFPGLGTVKRSPQKSLQEVTIELEDLEPFHETLKEYPNIGVLTSTLVVKDQFSGKPCALSAECLAQFPTKYSAAVLIADQITQQFVDENNMTMAEGVKQAIMAGNHFVILDEQLALSDITTLISRLTELYGTDPAFAAKVDQAIAKVETLKRPRQIDKPANGAILPILENRK